MGLFQINYKFQKNHYQNDAIRKKDKKIKNMFIINTEISLYTNPNSYYNINGGLYKTSFALNADGHIHISSNIKYMNVLKLYDKYLCMGFRYICICCFHGISFAVFHSFKLNTEKLIQTFLHNIIFLIF